MPPRVAPQQVVVIPIPNAKMTGDDKQVPTFVIVFNNFVSTLCACATDCVALLVLVCDCFLSPDAKQTAVVSACQYISQVQS